MPKRPDLSHLRQGDGIEDSFAIRGFSTFDSLDQTAENNWLMEDLPRQDWLESVHNIHQGKRCFIFGTGPSLASQLPLLHHMKDEDTWTVNRMRLWYAKGELPFIPTHHVVAEPGPCTNWGKVIMPLYDFPEAENRIALNWWRVDAPGWLWCPKAPDDIQIRWQGFFGLGDHLPPLPTGWASPLTVSQLACWMGYEELYLLGIDTTQEGQAWDVEAGRTLSPRSIRSICESFDRARMDIERAGRKMWDCTPGGLINQRGILEYRDLETILANS